VNARPLVLALTGDVMLGRLVNEEIARSGFTRPWGDMLSWFRQADLRLINLECALTDYQERWTGDRSKPFFFRSGSRNVETLNVAGIDFACIANNHIGDFGPRGLLDTVQILDSANIKHAGSGADLAAARSPVMLESQGYRISIVAFADHPAAWAAGPNRPGLSFCSPASESPSDFAPVESVIRKAREDCDLLMFTIHWGPNMRVRPSVEFQQFARRVIDAGVDVFWGHSAHVVQGIEIYRGRPILYDTGDFLDDYIVDADLRNDLSALFLVHALPPRVVGIELVPVRIHDMQVNQAIGLHRATFVEQFTDRCSEMDTTISDNQTSLSLTLTQ
jgi:poly-gamma-glutamate capsule biosynthesis protein CapA/YwtB (metallophosphatase superfamily)